MHVSRRRFIQGGDALAAVPTRTDGSAQAAARTGRPAAVPIGRGGRPTEPGAVFDLARRIGQGEALCFVDLAAFDHNLEQVLGVARRNGSAVRPALKSFESPRFVAYCLQQLPQPRGMVFHLRTVDAILERAPAGTDLMLGYPPSSGELARFLGTAPPRRAKRGHRVRILVDSLELLQRVVDLAPTSRRGPRTEVALQLESGFYLSGFRTADELRPALDLLRKARDRVELTAVLCYDGHAASQDEGSLRRVVVADAKKRFAAWNDQLRAEAADVADLATLVRNGPASSTYRIWDGDPSPNEISPGACLQFHGYITNDGQDNDGYVPTLLHAAPVCRLGGTPVVPITGEVRYSDKESVAVKGGAWPNNAGTVDQVVFPGGLEEDELSGGRGNNQSSFLMPPGLLKRGDYIVLRPKHAGDAIDYFDTLVAIREGEVKRVWPTFRRPGAAA